jgi:RNA polymerase sigma-70 factor (ECF subfamily)
VFVVVSIAACSTDRESHDGPKARAAAWTEYGFAEHEPALRAAAVHLCRKAWETDDLVQDTFERALRHLSQGNPAPLHMRGWLVSILRNAFIDRVRRRAVTFEPIADHAEPERDPEPAWAQVSLDEIRAAVARLDGELRSVFELHYIEGLRYKVVAAKLRVPENTVASRLFRARKALRVELLRHAGAEADLRHGRTAAWRSLVAAYLDELGPAAR